MGSLVCPSIHSTLFSPVISTGLFAVEHPPPQIQIPSVGWDFQGLRRLYFGGGPDFYGWLVQTLIAVYFIQLPFYAKFLLFTSHFPPKMSKMEDFWQEVVPPPKIFLFLFCLAPGPNTQIGRARFKGSTPVSKCTRQPPKPQNISPPKHKARRSCHE